MKNGKLRGLSVLLAVALLLTVMPGLALAAAEKSYPLAVRMVSAEEFGERPVDATLSAHYTGRKVTGLRLSKSSLKLQVGQASRMRLIVSGTGTKPNFNDITFNVSVSGVLDVITTSVGGDAMYFDIVGIGGGTSKLTVGLEGKKASVTVRVSAPEPGSIRLSRGNLTMLAGETARLEAYVYPNTTGQQVNWKSSNAKIAHVASDGTVTARKKGSATITASRGGYQAKCTVKIGNTPTPERDFKFVVENGYACITKYTGSAAHVILPDRLSGYPVYVVDPNAFEGNKKLVSIVMPDDFYVISYEAFQNCEQLRTVVMPDSTFIIGDNAFDGCLRLTDIKLPSQLEYLGRRAFYGVYSMREAIVPRTVTDFKEGAFEACFRLNNVSLPDTITAIPASAFRMCVSLTSIKLPSALKEIGDKAFEFCPNLSDITIPNSVTTIGKEAFEDCDNLLTVTIGSGVQTIGDNAFSYCLRLNKVTIPYYVSGISDTAFTGSNRVTIYGYRYSYAYYYAQRLGIAFVAL